MDTMLNVVVVEDHHTLRELTVKALSMAGHRVIGLDCAEALAELKDFVTDIVVIDLNLPGESGLSLAKRIRQAQPDVGIVMLTAKIQVADKLLGYASGADIYPTKPSTLEELNAAIHALARRIKPKSPKAQGLKLMQGRRLLIGSSQSIGLSQLEVNVLVAFTRAAEQQLEYWQLLELISSSEKNYSKDNLEVIITRLRKKIINAGSNPHPIKSIRQFGYQLCHALTLNQ